MIIKRSDRYAVRTYHVGRQVWVGTYRTLKEAREAERTALVQKRPTRDETIKDFAERWLRDFKRPRASTNRHNGYMVKPLVSELGHLRLADVTRRQAREWALRHRYSVPVVRAMFNDALNEECVTTNPFANLRLDQSRGRKDLNVISHAELDALGDQP